MNPATANSNVIRKTNAEGTDDTWGGKGVETGVETGSKRGQLPFLTDGTGTVKSEFFYPLSGQPWLPPLPTATSSA